MYIAFKCNFFSGNRPPPPVKTVSEERKPETSAVPSETKEPAAASQNPSVPYSPRKYELKKKGLKIKDLESNGGKRYAVIIGINKYEDIQITSLEKARNDAKVIADTLKKDGEFEEVFLMTDDIDKSDSERRYPTKINIEEKIESVLRNAQPEDLIVFFFSGHGISDADNNSYLIAADTISSNELHSSGKEKRYATAVNVSEQITKFKAKGIKKLLLMIDACREKMNTTKSVSREELLKEYTDSEILATFYATGSGYYSYEDDESEYGVFSRYVVQGMEGKADSNADGVVTFTELKAYVEKGVSKWSLRKNKQQKPFTKLDNEMNGDLAITFSGKNSESRINVIGVRDEKRKNFYKSAVLPGWGQFARGDKIRGVLYGTAFFAGLGALASSYSQFNHSRENYISKRNQDLLFSTNQVAYGQFGLLSYMNTQHAKSEIQNHANTGNLIQFGILAFYAWNLFDAYFLSKPKDPDAASTLNSFNPFGFQLYSRQTILPTGIDRQMEMKYAVEF
ncbi:MAG TPA: caspase family protein [Leptospiraceae bacterium]|nr:caspase family protein [Leptospiraceae bacterium]